MSNKISGNSRPVQSNQADIYPNLIPVVMRHLCDEWQEPVSKLAVACFDAFVASAGSDLQSKPLILDSCCGTGRSSLLLGQAFPDHLIVGLDRSASRLRKSNVTGNILRSGNVILVRTEVAQFWRLLYRSAIRLERHYLLYPNPSPKAKHFRRRWHGHPAFPYLILLGGVLELRTNWKLYAEEMRVALAFAGVETNAVKELPRQQALSPFEEKYAASKHALYQLVAHI